MGLVGHWPLNGNTNDISGNSNDGVATSVVYASGKIGQAYENDSGLSRFVTVSNTPNVIGNQTIAMWLYPTSNSRRRNPWNKSYGGEGTITHETSGTLNYYWGINGPDGGTYQGFGSSFNLPLNQWSHIAIIRDLTNGLLKWCLNGVVMNTAIPSYSAAAITTNPILIGNGYTSTYLGRINDVRLYDHALSDKELKELAQAKILHYTFDDFQEPTTNICYNLGDDYYDKSRFYSTDGDGFTEVIIANKKWLRYDSGNRRLAALTIAPNTIYTWSLKIISPSNGTIAMSQWDGGSYGYQTYSISTGYNEISHIFTSRASSTYEILHMGSFPVGSFLADFQLEKKSYSTPYTKNSRNGKVKDYSGFFNHSTDLTNENTPRWISDSKIGAGAYQFRSSDAKTYIQPPSNLYPTYVDFTVSAWIYFTSEPTDTNLGYVIAQHYGGGGWIFSVRGTDEKLQFRHHRDTANGFTTAYNLLSTINLQTNTWYHVAAKDDGTTAKIYINGIENNSFTISSIIPGPSSVVPGIGAFNTSGNGHFDGIIDDVRIYSTALSDSDILDLYQTRAEIEQNGNLYAIDFESNKMQSLLLNYTQWTASSGSIGNFNQNGTTDENVRILGIDPWGKQSIVWETRPAGDAQADGGWNSSSFAIDTNYAYRFSIWVKRITSGASGNFYLGLNPAPVRNDNGALQSNPYFVCPGTDSLAENQWYLVVGHIMPYYYKDGRHPDSGVYTIESGNLGAIFGSCNLGAAEGRWEQSTGSALHRAYHYYSNTTARLQFLYPRMDKIDGTEPSIGDLLSGIDSRNLDYLKLNSGVINEKFNINTNLFSASDFSTVGITNGLVGYWPLNKDTRDLSGLNSTENTRTAISWVSGKIDGGADLNGTTSKIYINNNNVFNFTGNQQYTVMAIIYPRLGGATWHGIFSKGNSQQWALTLNSPNGYLHYETNQGGVGALDTPVGSIQANNWYHVVIRFNGTNKQIFINGVSAASQTATALNSASNTEVLRIGEGNTGELFNGIIDEVKVFNRALTDEEIKIEYNTMFNNEVQISESGILYAKDLKQY